MSEIPSVSASRDTPASFAALRVLVKPKALAAYGLIATAAVCGLIWKFWEPESHRDTTDASSVVGAKSEKGNIKDDGSVRLDADQQKAVGLNWAKVSESEDFEVLSAPGRVGPNETQYAFITPRAAGVVRSVMAHIGQDVKAGDLLATIDSPEVGQARLDLYTRLQERDLAQAQANWQEQVHASTIEMLERIRRGETPEEIHGALETRPVGDNRERLMTAYAQYRLAKATMDRNRDLHAQHLITEKQIQSVTAEFDVARSVYQTLMDQTGYESRLAHTKAQQTLKQVEASVRASQERLRILGVKPDGTEPRVEQGKVVEVARDGTLSQPVRDQKAPNVNPEQILPKARENTVEPVGTRREKTANLGEAPVSTFSIWAPLDGTILEREMIVPGVAVDTTHRLFTIANLSTVWIEASIHESDFDKLARSRGSKVRFRSPAYPARIFEGKVVYSGDLVDEKSRTVKLLAEAENPDRLLRSGMFVDVEILTPRETPAVRVPSTALLTRDGHSFVFVRSGDDRFLPRKVSADEPRGETATVKHGLEPGEEVVVSGGAKLKAMAEQGGGIQF